MKTTEVSNHEQLRVGQEVMVIPESGRLEGQRLKKTISRIILLEWTQDESRSLGNPQLERLVYFTDGSSAGSYDMIAPC